MATMYYDDAADLALIRGKKVGGHRLRIAGARARAEPAATAASSVRVGLPATQPVARQGAGGGADRRRRRRGRRSGPTSS